MTLPIGPIVESPVCRDDKAVDFGLQASIEFFLIEFLFCSPDMYPKWIFYPEYTVVILLKATKGKSQNRISLEQQRFLKNDKSESFLNFYLVYKYVSLKFMR